MANVIPPGFLTLHESIDLLRPYAFPNGDVSKAEKASQKKDPAEEALQEKRSAEETLREKSAPNYRSATDRIVDAIWKAEAAGTLTAYAFGGKSRCVLRLDRYLVEAIPLLRHPRNPGFAYLRLNNPAAKKFVACFGADISAITLVFEETEIRKLRQPLKRRRIYSTNRARSGPPSLIPEIKNIIRELVAKATWCSQNGIKKLTQLVNRQLNRPKPVSTETVRRALNAYNLEVQGVFDPRTLGPQFWPITRKRRS